MQHYAHRLIQQGVRSPDYYLELKCEICGDLNRVNFHGRLEQVTDPRVPFAFDALTVDGMQSIAVEITSDYETPRSRVLALRKDAKYPVVVVCPAPDTVGTLAEGIQAALCTTVPDMPLCPECVVGLWPPYRRRILRIFERAGIARRSWQSGFGAYRVKGE